MQPLGWVKAQLLLANWTDLTVLLTVRSWRCQLPPLVALWDAVHMARCTHLLIPD